MKTESVGRNPLPIVKEYLVNSEPRVRTNAAAALAAIASRESLAELVKLALTDQDAGVSAAAAREIERLSEEDRSYCIDLALDALDDPGLQRRASNLLAELRNQGVSLPSSRLSFSDLLSLSVRARSGSTRARRSLWRALTAAALGGLLGAVILLAALESLGSIAPKVQVLLLVTSLAGSAVLGVASAHFCRPLSAYLDRRIGAAVEMGAVFVATLLPLLGLSLPYLVFWSPEKRIPLEGDRALVLLGGIIGAGLFAGAVRGGTMIGAFVARRPWQRIVAQVLIGGAAGMLALTGIFYGIAMSLQAQEQSAFRAFYLGWWLFLLPCAVGDAAAIASVDTTSSRGGFWIRLSAIVTGLLLMTAVLALWWSHPAREEPPILERLARSETLNWGPFTELPASRLLELDFPQSVRIETDKEGVPEARRFDLYLIVSKGSRKLRTVDGPEPPKLEMDFPERGKYRIDVVEFQNRSEKLKEEEALRVSYFAVAGRLANMGLEESADGPGFRVKVTLNSKPSFALNAAVPDLLERGLVQEAVMAFDRAVTLDSKLAVSLPTLEKICRLGSLQGHAKQVLEQCDRAVEIAPIAFVLDSRGIARTLAQDYAGAAEDFRKVAVEAVDKKTRSLRALWADALEDGKDPISAERIVELLRDSKTRSFDHRDRQKLLQRGLRRFAEGAVSSGIQSINLAIEGAPEERLGLLLWEDLCWYGALRADRKDVDQVAQICDRGPMFFDLRSTLGFAIARAHNKDWPGAIDVLSNFVSLNIEVPEPEANVLSENSDQWIKSLQAGKDPFTPEEIARIEKIYPVPDLKQLETRLLTALQEAEKDQGPGEPRT